MISNNFTLNFNFNSKNYSEEEYNIRVQLAACYRLFDLFGW